MLFIDFSNCNRRRKKDLTQNANLKKCYITVIFKNAETVDITLN